MYLSVAMYLAVAMYLLVACVSCSCPWICLSYDWTGFHLSIPSNGSPSLSHKDRSCKKYILNTFASHDLLTSKSNSFHFKYFYFVLQRVNAQLPKVKGTFLPSIQPGFWSESDLVAASPPGGPAMAIPYIWNKALPSCPSRVTAKEREASGHSGFSHTFWSKSPTRWRWLFRPPPISATKDQPHLKLHSWGLVGSTILMLNFWA